MQQATLSLVTCRELPFNKKSRHFSDFLAVREGFEPSVQLPVRQFSKLVVSATHPSHLTFDIYFYRVQIYKLFFILQNIAVFLFATS